jgi:hypothetical protein
MNFRVGQKVVAITDVWTVISGGEGSPPTKGGVYTVTSVEPWGNYNGIRVAEKPQPNLYDVKGFRPAVEPSIEIFTAMLKKTRKENVRLAKRPVKESA